MICAFGPAPGRRCGDVFALASTDDKSLEGQAQAMAVDVEMRLARPVKVFAWPQKANSGEGGGG